jgi:hypothetical protein
MASDDDTFIWLLDSSLQDGTPLFCIFSPDGTLQMPCAELLRTKYSGQFKIVGPSSVPTIKELHRVNRSTPLETGEIERSYQGLLRFIGCKNWPEILIISNTESLSADQALALRGCLNERESDEPTDWPRSIIFVLKQGESLPADLHKFVWKVLEPDA